MNDNENSSSVLFKCGASQWDKDPDDQTSLVNRSRPPTEPSSGRGGLPLRPLWQVRGEDEELIIVDRYHRYRSWSCGSNSTKSGNRKRKHTKVQPCTPLGTKLSSLVVKGAGVSGPDYSGTLTSVSDNGNTFMSLGNILNTSQWLIHSQASLSGRGYCNLEQQQIEPSTSQRTLGLEEMMGLNRPITGAVVCIAVMCSYISLNSLVSRRSWNVLLVKHFLLQTERRGTSCHNISGWRLTAD